MLNLGSTFALSGAKVCFAPLKRKVRTPTSTKKLFSERRLLRKLGEKEIYLEKE